MHAWPGRPQVTATSFGHLTRSQLMSRIPSRGNKTTELRLIALLRRTKLRGWRRRQRIFGNPDLVWRRERIAVFVDGCFWHGHNCNRNLTPKRNSKIWQRKILLNKRRDRLTSRILKGRGWTVIRIWECSLKQEARCISRICKELGEQKTCHVPSGSRRCSAAAGRRTPKWWSR